MHDLKIRFQIHDVLFCILLVLSFLFTRNIACSMMMVAFFGYTVMRQITKTVFVTVCHHLRSTGIR